MNQALKVSGPNALFEFPNSDHFAKEVREQIAHLRVEYRVARTFLRTVLVGHDIHRLVPQPESMMETFPLQPANLGHASALRLSRTATLIS
jgi:hypothetical protein